ncbi:MAG: FAD-binding oxidoreductase [Gemmatimonadetes bacterium]|nr:FAD-binding oxidoreductase [Gemmatimonadota bacterium]
MATEPRALVTDPAVCEAYAADVSGLRQPPARLARPAETRETLEVLRQAAVEGWTVTAAGAQTSTTGASVADEGGTLLSTARLDRIIDIDTGALRARVEPGVIIGDLNRALAPEGLFFPPDPTSENEATVGGAVACNASGARTLRYGPTRHYVRGLRVALADGSVVDLVRPALEKNTVGYLPAQDPVDWFVGSEGTLGVILEVDLDLRRLPESVVGLGIPFPNEVAALEFIVAARRSERLAARCLEYFDATAFGFARDARGGGAWGEAGDTMVYLEEAGADEPDFEGWLELAADHRAREDEIAVFDGEAALRDARRLRHACPAAMHEATGPYLQSGGRRISTDWAVPFPDAPAALAEARAAARAAGLESPVVYGHLGNGHPHLNWVARNPAEVAQIEDCVEAILRRSVLPRSGTVAAEHGVGKIKARWLPLQMSPLQIRFMRALKKELDPAGRLAPGNVLSSL